MVTFAVCRVYPSGSEQDVSGQAFEVGKKWAGATVIYPDEPAALAAAVEHAARMQDENFPDHYIVRRTDTEVVWDGDQA